TAIVWDWAPSGHRGQPRVTLRGHTNAVLSAAFSPDGQSIVTASWDKTAIVWDAASGQARATLRGHTGPVNTAAFSPDGRYVVTPSADGTARQYVIPIPDLLALAQSRVFRSLTPEERAISLGEPLLTPTPIAIPAATPSPATP